MALSGQYNYTTTRDNIITRALRIIGAISQGETPTATALSEAGQTLNEIFLEWQSDGLQLWTTRTIPLSGSLVAGPTISIANNPPPVAVDDTAPLKVHAMWHRDANGNDVPINLITKDQYDRLTPKLVQGIPNQCYYEPPGTKIATTVDAIGTFYLFPAMSSDFISNYTIYVTGTFPLQKFDISSDQPDIPDYLINALVWALADQLAYEYGVGLAERSMISKKAQLHKAMALAFDQEEGSLFIRPTYAGQWEKTI